MLSYGDFLKFNFLLSFPHARRVGLPRASRGETGLPSQRHGMSQKEIIEFLEPPLYDLFAPDEDPTGLAFNTKAHRLFSVTDKLMIITDSQTEEVVTTVVEEVNENEFKIVEAIPTQAGARTMGINTKTHRLYLPTAEYEPAPTTENPNPGPAVKPGSFVILEIGFANEYSLRN